MSKYIFATKFKKIEKEPLYYNMQLSVDKDCTASSVGYKNPVMEDTYFYKDSPIILTFISRNHWEDSKNFGLVIEKPSTYTNLYLKGMIFFRICDGDYPLPEIIQVDHNGTIFTFTPIPVYE